MNLTQENLDKLNQTLSHLYSNVFSFAIQKEGKILFEQYYHGARQNDTRSVASVSKSVLSALIGIAMEQGYLSDENSRVLDFFPEYLNADSDPSILRIRLKNLLTMTSGFYYLRLAADSQPIAKRRESSNDWIEYMMNVPIKHPDLKTFCYSNFDADLCAAILQKVLPMDLYDFANDNLFSKVGMNIPRWNYGDPQKMIPESFHMSTSDMLKFGRLYLQNGIYDGKEIISPSWIEKSHTNYGNGYGYLWWLSDNMYYASGAGGSVIAVIPKEQIVVASQCKILKTNWKSPLQALSVLS